jgi:hypothetical protein
MNSKYWVQPFISDEAADYYSTSTIYDINEEHMMYSGYSLVCVYCRHVLPNHTQRTTGKFNFRASDLTLMSPQNKPLAGTSLHCSNGGGPAGCGASISCEMEISITRLRAA